MLSALPSKFIYRVFSFLTIPSQNPIIFEQNYCSSPLTGFTNSDFASFHSIPHMVARVVILKYQLCYSSAQNPPAASHFTWNKGEVFISSINKTLHELLPF